MEIDQGSMAELMRLSIQNGTNFMVFGNAGIGKTEMAIQECERAGVIPVYLNLSVLEGPDLQGIPYRTQDNKTAYAIPEKFEYRSAEGPDKRRVALIVDELDKSRPELQNPMLELFQYRSINGTLLNIHSIIATGNLPDENSHSQPVSHALMNRCAVYKTKCEFEPWRKWAVSVGEVHSLVVGFLNRNPDKLLVDPPDGDDTAYVHPSPRSWTYAGQDLNSLPKDTDTARQALVVAGRVGTAAAADFQTWLDHHRHIEPYVDALVKEGRHPQPDVISALDRCFVFSLSAMSEMVKVCKAALKVEQSKERDRKEAVRHSHEIVDRVMKFVRELPPEIQVGVCKSTLDEDLIQKLNLIDVQSLMDVFNNIRRTWQDGAN